jgi:hypothetical protein
MRTKFVIKILLSFWIVYTIFMMLVMPNLGSYLGRSSSRYITPYANSVGLNANWNFFSPDPAPTMYIQFRIHFLDSEGYQTKDSVDGFFPAEKNRRISSIFRQRELYVMRYMLIDPKRLKTFMGPWLCRQYPGATSVEMEHVVETIANLDQMVVLKGEGVESLSTVFQNIHEVFSCVDASDEVSS